MFGYDSFHGMSDVDLQLDAVASSDDQVAAVWNAAGEVVTASPLPHPTPGSFDMDVTRYPTDHDLSHAIDRQRTQEFGLPPLSTSTRYLTTVGDYSERTRILALDGERLGLDDPELKDWLIDAEKERLLGTDHHPVFETSLDDTACTIRRLPNGRVAMTEVPRSQVKALEVRMRLLAGGRPDSRVSLCIETPLRCAARYFLTATRQGVETLREGRGVEVTAFLLLGVAGYSFGLWSPQAGLFTEYGFLAPEEVSRKRSKRQAFAGGTIEQPQPDSAVDLKQYISQAFEQLLLQMSTDKLEDLQLSNYSQLVWGAEKSIFEIASPIAEECGVRTGLEIIPIDVPSDEAAAAGLLLGSYKFGQASVAGARALPPVNLAQDLLAQEDTEEIERLREEEARIQARRSRIVMTILAPPIIAAAFIFALIAQLIVSYLATSWRDERADTRAAELKPAVERRKSYEANLKWYQEFISEVGQLRQQQPAGLGLFRQLDANYPMAMDPTFFVAELKLLPNGDIELRGLSKNKDAVAEFLKGLEFAANKDTGARLFSNLAYEVRDAGALNSPMQQLPPAGASTSTLVAVTTTPGVFTWRVTGNYGPVAKFAPTPTPSPQPGQPAAPAQPQQPPAAAPQAAKPGV